MTEGMTINRLKSTRAEISKAKMVAVAIGVFRRAIKVISGVASPNKVAARKVDGRGRAPARKAEGRKGAEGNRSG